MRNEKRCAIRLAGVMSLVCAIMVLGPLMPARAEDSGVLRTLYVDVHALEPNGDGDISRPFKSIQAAVDQATPGTKVLVRQGTYRENVVLRTSGTAEHPIFIEGERGPKGEYLTLVDSSELVSHWEMAPEIGAGVYKARLGYNPGHINLNGLQLGRLSNATMQGKSGFENLTGFDFLKSPSEYQVNLAYPAGNLKTVNFWDAIYGVFGTLNDTTYLRLKGGRDPNLWNILASKSGASAFQFYNGRGEYITIRNFQIQGMEYGIKVAGSLIHHIVIEENRILNGRQRIYVTKARDLTIRRNEMTMNIYGAQPGVWGGVSEEYDSGLKQYVYVFFKTIASSDSTSDDIGIYMLDAGDRNEISENHLHDGLIGILLQNSGPTVKNYGIRVSKNQIENHSSLGLGINPGFLDAHIYENVISNNHANLRIYHLHFSSLSEIYIYNNQLLLPENQDRGNHIFLYWEDKKSQPIETPVILLYHNSLMGGYSGIYFNDWGHQYGGLPKAQVINNIFSARHNIHGLRAGSVLESSSAFGGYDYNWVGKSYLGQVAPSWFGEHNIQSENGKFFDETLRPGTPLPTGNPAIEAGVDLSRPFTVNGKSFDALPGMGAGYFAGKAPNLGVIIRIYGDISGDGQITAEDARRVAKYAVGLIDFTADQRKAADVSGDGLVNSHDAMLIAQRAVGLIEKFPVEGS